MIAMRYLCYNDLMEDGTPFIELRLCLAEPAELFALVSAFTAIGNQFERYLRESHPNLVGAAKLYVREIRKGSTIVELIPVILPLIENMDRILIVDGFVRRYGGVLQKYLSGNREETATKNDISDFMGQVGVIATDPNGTSTISSAVYNQTKTTKRIEIKFDTAGARKAKEALDKQALEITLPAFEEQKRVMMRFFQSNLSNPSVGSPRTGERVVIESVSSRPLALIYETDLAKERIKHETSADDGNLYKKGFLVDCFVVRSEGRPVAYRVTAVHEVFDLPGDT